MRVLTSGLSRKVEPPTASTNGYFPTQTLMSVGPASTCAEPTHAIATSMSNYFFTIRGRDRVVEEDPRGTYLPDDAAALTYAEHSVRELRKKSGCNDAALMMVVQDQVRQPVWFVPFYPGS
jgi:hypothetical protein